MAASASGPIMVRVAQRGRYSVYVYDERGGRHHLPHCHVRWSDGEAEVELPNFERLKGDALPVTARRLVGESVADLIAAWNRLNPERTIG